MITGNLIVMGTNQVQVELGSKPIRLEVSFSDSGDIIVPCNPHYSDKLDWTISNGILTINWQVSGVREIKWNVWQYWSELNT